MFGKSLGMAPGMDMAEGVDETGTKSKVLADLLEYLQGGQANELKDKYAPPPAEKPKLTMEGADGAVDKGIPAGANGIEDADPEALLADLDPKVLEQLLGGG